MPGFWLVDAGASYTLGEVGPLSDLKFAANVTNLAGAQDLRRVREPTY